MSAVLILFIAALLIGWRVRRNRLQVTSQRRRAPALVFVAILLGAQVILGGTAHAQSVCAEPPEPDRPASGMVGAFDPTPMDAGIEGTPYREVGYAGLVWHTYDLGCGPEGLRNPNAVIDTWAGNQIFNVGKVIVGATNGLHYALLEGHLMKPLDDMIATGTIALYDTVYAPWFGLAAVILAVLLFRYIWQGDLASIGKRTLWMLVALWLAAATYLTPLIYTRLLDDVLIKGTSQIQAGFLKEIGVEERHSLPTLLHENVVYRNWLRGEFGSADSAPANDIGRNLLRAQTFTKQEIADGADKQYEAVKNKKDAFRAEVGRAEAAGTKGYLQGINGSRMGTGVLSLFQALAYSLFQLLAKVAILLGQVLFRVIILAGPIIGLIAMLYHAVLRSIGRVVGAALLNVIVISLLAGLHVLLLSWIFAPIRGLSLLTQMALAAVVTLGFILVGKPIRRLWQMVEVSAGAVGASVPSSFGGVFSRLRGKGKGEIQTPQTAFWAQISAQQGVEDTPQALPRGGRVRPETASSTGFARSAVAGSATSVNDVVRATSVRTDGTAARSRAELNGSRAIAALSAGRDWNAEASSVVVPSRLGQDVTPAENSITTDDRSIYSPTRGIMIEPGSGRS